VQTAVGSKQILVEKSRGRAINIACESGIESLITGLLATHSGYERGVSADYSRECAFDEARLFSFLEEAQPE
jgi:hypothetical protein